VIDLLTVAGPGIQLTAFFLRDPDTAGRRVELRDATDRTSVG
jgi:hypothetical protein